MPVLEDFPSLPAGLVLSQMCGDKKMTAKTECHQVPVTQEPSPSWMRVLDFGVNQHPMGMAGQGTDHRPRVPSLFVTLP